MPVAVLVALALVAQPTPPATALPPKDEPRKVKIPPNAKPAEETATEPSAVAGAKGLAFEPKTLVDGEILQVILGQRALFRLDDKNAPVLSKVEEGKLAEAHPAGEVTASFEPPPDGQVAAALDGSAEKRASVLKVWNGTASPLEYRAIALIMQHGEIAAVPAPPAGCAIAPHSAHAEVWPRPVVAVGLGRFRTAPAKLKACK
jgi:hypothetical protein